LSESTLFLYPLLLIVIVVSLITFIYAQEQQEKEERYSFIDKWDSEGSGDGQLSTPHSIDVDSNNGNVYIADSGNNRSRCNPVDCHFLIKTFSTNSLFLTLTFPCILFHSVA